MRFPTFSPSRTFAAAVTVILFSASAHAFQSVHVVNGGAGAALQAVIDAAASGDTVLVHGGNFGAVQIVGKSLTLVSEPTQSSTVAGLRIANTNVGQPTTISGFRVATPAYTGTPPIPECIVIDQCAGGVRFQSVLATVQAPNGSPALRVNSSHDVALINSAFLGSDGLVTPVLAFLSPPWGEGIRAVQSSIVTYDCAATGGKGMNGFTQDQCTNPFTWSSSAGAPGLSMDAGSIVFGDRTTFAGGAGGNGRAARCDCFVGTLIPGTNGRDGGAGVENAVGSSFTNVGGLLSGGNGGLGGTPASCSGTPAGGGTAGSMGPPSTNPINDLALTSASPRVGGPLVIRAGQTLTLQLQGTGGDLGVLGQSFETRWVPFTAAKGVLAIGPSGRRVALGAFPGSGTITPITIDIPAQLTVPGAQAQQWHLQAYAYVGGAIQVGAAWEVTVLAAGF